MITAGRKNAGLQQSELASILGTTQQTVSRWEAGTSRPSAHQLRKLAHAVRTTEEVLLEAAGYPAPREGVSPVSAGSLDQAFPVDALSPESFERFLEYLLPHLYLNAREIRRAGKSGHTQRGVDVLVVLGNGERHTFQCKRVLRFGPADVKDAVRHHTEPAERKHIVLSRVASPQTAETVRQFEGWELWDKEDIARLIRTRLAKVDQVRLVDTFFPGQRLALLGVPPPGAWQTPEEFFAPFEGKSATFSHDWPLVGRKADVENVVRELTLGDNRIVLLSGAGGLGKSRLLKQVVKRLRVTAPELNPLFLSPTEPISAQSLDLLGGKARVLIVDDAHDRTDLPALFAFVASRNAVRILLASRPYAVARLRGQAGEYARGGSVDEIVLGRLTLPESIELAAEVLKDLEGNSALAEPIARATQDCPLVTVMAARIAVTENLSLGLAQNTQSFRDTILGKFAKIITGELAPPGEQKAFTDILKVVSLVQPVGIGEPEFRELAAEVTGLDEDTISTTLRTLADGGIIFRRGNEYRLMPDLLGDYIIEQTCIGVGDQLNSFAGRVFVASSRTLLGHALVNLGRLDWRRNGGDPSKSHLLTHLWRALKVTGDFHDSALEAASAAAYYQPRQAIDFVAEQARKGLRHEELSKILKHAAYNLDYVENACALLWELGRDDEREMSRFPGHPMRTLTELCTVEPNRPIAFNEKVVSFGLSLLDDKDSFRSLFTPFDFLKGILRGAGETTISDNRSLTFKPFIVNYEAVDALRKGVIGMAVRLLRGNSLRSAAKAAGFLKGALRYPMPPFSAELPHNIREKYTVEFRETLGTIKRLVTAGNLDPVIMIAIAHAVSWHANFAENATARAIVRALPDTLEVRTLSALVDGFGSIFLGRPDANTWQTRLNKWMAEIVADLSTAYPNAADLRQFLESCLARIAEAQLAKEDSTNTLVRQVLQTRPDFALDLVENASHSSGSRLAVWLGSALFFVLQDNRVVGRRWSRRLLDSGDARFQCAVGNAYDNPPLDNGLLAPEDSDVLIRVLSSSDPSVVHSGLGALGALARNNPRLAIDLLRHANLKLNPGLADSAFMYLHGNRDEVLRALEDDDVRFILSELKSLAELNGYWIETLLSYLSLHFAELTCVFFLDRADIAAASNESFSRIRPINYGPWVNVPLQFKQSVHYTAVLERVWSWMIAHDPTDWRFEHHAAAIFEGMFLPIDEAVIASVTAKLATASKQDLRWVAAVLSHTDANFVFDYQTFVMNFLDACGQAGQTARRKGIDALFRGAISGVRSGRPGEPFPRDLESLSRVEAILPRLPRLSPAYELYDLIRRHAEQSIEHQRQEAEFFDEE
jgi:transcriptional regulator with XRE-family HTH domain